MVAGLALTYAVQEKLALLGELHWQGTSKGNNQELLANIGTVAELTEYAGLLLSVGKTFSDFNGDPHRFLLYAGVQLHL
jgi:hypothetical protein